MKTIIFSSLMMMTTSLMAKSIPIFPQIFNFGNSVQVQIYNPNVKDYFCSGMLYMNYFPVGIEGQYYSEVTRSQSTTFRMFYPFRIGTSISNVTHSIYCYEI